MIAVERLIKMRPGEKVVFAMRMHWLLFAADIGFTLLLAAIPYAAFVGIQLSWTGLLDNELARTFIILFGSAYYLNVGLFFMIRFIDFYLDAYVVTTQRVLDVSQRGLFSRTVSELDLSRVEDVTSEVHGIIRTVFRYGDVYIQTAAERERFVFEGVSEPDEIRKRLLSLVDTETARKKHV